MKRPYILGWAVWQPLSGATIGVYALALEAYAHEVAAQRGAQVVPMWRSR